MIDLELPTTLVTDVLRALDAPVARPSIRHLNRLIAAYARRVPWESASRIARRQQVPATQECPRWPAEFWASTLAWGTGGTCFESNLAFRSLLSALGYHSVLTINDMREMRSCHSALIVTLDSVRYLVDVGIPLHVAARIGEHVSRRAGPFHIYSVRPDGPHRFQIERSHHPLRNIYTLLDQPVAEHDYTQAVIDDYGEQGLFLNRVVITKIVGGAVWRFSSSETPYRLECFTRAGKQEQPLPNDCAEILAQHFGMAVGIIRDALAVVA
jgi:arylamine N-acetyltransferase